MVGYPNPPERISVENGKYVYEVGPDGTRTLVRERLPSYVLPSGHVVQPYRDRYGFVYDITTGPYPQWFPEDGV